jgi:hypothetical protein
MKRLMWYVGCCLVPMVGASATHAASPDIKTSATTATGDASILGKLSSTDYHQALTATPTVAKSLLAQVPPPPPAPTAPTEVPGGAPGAIPANPGSSDVQGDLDRIRNNQPDPTQKVETYSPKTSPAFAIFNPVGYGADNNLVFFSLDYQSRTRFGDVSDGGAGLGVGFGDATNGIGVEVSYSLNSFGSSAAFGSGAFNAKIHKRFSEDTSVAVGWNQFAKVNLGAGNNGSSAASDYPNNSYYISGTKILRTVDDINSPFSRVALTAGVGGGVFAPFDSTTINPSGVGVFGSVGVRIARPISAVVEWTGQDLAAGVSIAPFENFPLVITPAIRDIGFTAPAGQKGGTRFVISAGLAFNF